MAHPSEGQNYEDLKHVHGIDGCITRTTVPSVPCILYLLRGCSSSADGD